MSEKCVVEMVKYQNLSHNLLLSTTKCHVIGDLIAYERFSKIQRLLRVATYTVCEEIYVEIQFPH